MPTIPEIYSAAERCREDFECGLVTIGVLKACFIRQCPDTAEEAIRFYRDQRIGDMFPNGNCVYASVYLLDKLGYGRPKVGWYGVKRHTVLSFEDVPIKCAKGIQIACYTADQFGGPTVYAGSLVEPWSFDDPARSDFPALLKSVFSGIIPSVLP